jgi:hypothetical protein
MAGPTYHQTGYCKTCSIYIYDDRTSPESDDVDRAANRTAHKQHYIIQSLHRIEYCEVLHSERQ